MGLKGLFEISKLLFQYSPEKNGVLDNSPTLQYSSLKYFDHIQKLGNQFNPVILSELLIITREMIVTAPVSISIFCEKRIRNISNFSCPVECPDNIDRDNHTNLFRLYVRNLMAWFMLFKKYKRQNSIFMNQ